MNTTLNPSTHVLVEIVRAYRRDSLVDFTHALFSSQTDSRLEIELDWILSTLGMNPREASILILLQLRHPNAMPESELVNSFEGGVPQLHRVLRRMIASGMVRLHPRATQHGGPSVAITDAGREEALRLLLLYLWGLEELRTPLPYSLRQEIEMLCIDVSTAVSNMLSNDISESTVPALENASAFAGHACSRTTTERGATV